MRVFSRAQRIVQGAAWVLVAATQVVGCRDSQVDKAERVARQTGDKVVAGLEVARDKIEAVGGDVRDAAQQAGESVAEATAADPGAADALRRDADAAIECAAAEQCTVSREYVARLRANPGFLAGQARVQPYRRDGRAIGVEISGLEPLPKLLGFRDRDIVLSVNGLAVQSLQSAPQLYLQLRSARRFTVVFERGSEQLTRQIDVL